MERLLLLFAFIGVSTPMESSVINPTPDSNLNTTTGIPGKSFSEQNFKCKSDEVPVQNLPCVATCDEPYPKYCLHDSHFRESQCKCKDGYFRRSYKERECVPLGTCLMEALLPERKLPQSSVCGIDEEPLKHGGICIVTCSAPNVNFCSFHPENWEEYCKCKDGYVRLSYVQRKCVPKEDCSKYLGA